MGGNIYEVAKRAGVSITTVSHAFSGRGRVSPVTRETILHAAEELGYTANPHAQSLVSGRSRTIAIQIAGFTTQGRASVLLPEASYFMEVLNGAASAGAENDHALVLAPYDLTARRAQHLALDGGIVVDPAGDEPLLGVLRERGLPVVTTGRPTRGAITSPWVDNDHASLAVRMFDHLVAKGYRLPAVIATAPTRSYVMDIVEAYRRWAAQRDLEPQIVELPEPPSEVEAARAARRLLSQSEAPDAIYCTYDRLAVGVLLQAQRMHIRVPEDLGLASAVDSELLKRITPSITSALLNPQKIGRTAVQTLLSLLELGELDHSGVMVSSRLVPRMSSNRSGRVGSRAPRG